VLRYRLRQRLKVTVLGSLCVSPDRRRCRLLAEFLPERGITAEDLLKHLQRLRRTLRRPLIVVLDNLRLHKTKPLQAWCRKVGDVELAYLPAYAPELNPIEQVWRHGKYVTSAGRVVETVSELEALARESVEAAEEQRLLKGFLRGTRLPLQMDLHRRKNQSVAQ